MSKKTHGMRAIQRRGREAMEPAELMTMSELKLALRNPQVRMEVREELASRLIIMLRQGFDFLEKNPQLYETGKESPLGYMNGYANLLFRILDRWPSAVDEAIHVDELAKIDRVLADTKESGSE